MTPEQLGLGQKDLKVLRLPDGLEVVERGWFQSTSIEKLIVSSRVKTLGEYAFYNCKQLREVAFEPDSHLECIGELCFAYTSLREITIPSSVKSLGVSAFC